MSSFNVFINETPSVCYNPQANPEETWKYFSAKSMIDSVSEVEVAAVLKTVSNGFNKKETVFSFAFRFLINCFHVEVYTNFTGITKRDINTKFINEFSL